MVVFFLSVALTNLALGYALALYLHPHVEAGESPPLNLQPSGRAAAVDAAASSANIQFAPVSEPVAALTQDDAVDDTTMIESPEPTPHEQQVVSSAAPAEPPTSVEPEVELRPTVSPEPPVSKPAKAHLTVESEPSIECDDIRRFVNQFKLRLQGYQTKLTQIDQRVQACVEQPDAAQVQGCLRDLRTMNYEYFEQQLEISDQMAKSTGDADAATCAEINSAAAAQSAQISDVDCALVELDPDADAPSCARQLLVETAKLLLGSDAFAQALTIVEQELAAPKEVTHNEPGPAAG